MAETGFVKIPQGKVAEMRKGGLHMMLYKLPGNGELRIKLIMEFAYSGLVEVLAEKGSN